MKKVILKIFIILTAPLLCCYDGINDIYEEGRVYTKEDTGPAGGIICFVNPEYEKDGWRYLEMAPADEADAVWTTAGNICSSKSSGGFSDWSLPSIEELQIMRSSLTGVFSSSDYWSSTAIDSNNAYVLRFGDSSLPSQSGKTSARKVRAARKF